MFNSHSTGAFTPPLLLAAAPFYEVGRLTHICIVRAQITRLEFMHSRGVLHRDIQLGNCVIGLEPKQETIYMIDFGFSKRYLDQKQRHIANRAESNFIGNYWFSSVNVHCRGKSAHALFTKFKLVLLYLTVGSRSPPPNI